MDKPDRKHEAVPSTVYDEKFYLTNCADYDLFKTTGGVRISERLEGPFRLANVQAGQNILDIGCGRGEILYHAAHVGANAYGIDYSEDAIRLSLETRARLQADLKGEYLVARMDAKKLSYPDGFFDTVFMLDVIEHLHDWELEQVLAEVDRVLKKGSGKLVAHTAPNRWMLDIGYPYYTRWINWALKGPVRRLIGEEDIDNKLPTVPDLRSDYERVMHINEQTYPQLRRMLQRFFPSVKVMPIFLLHKNNPAFQIYDLVAKGYPISKFWPLHLIFADAFYAVAEKR